jgi:DNA-binding IclR family transcriptional regulator
MTAGESFRYRLLMAMDLSKNEEAVLAVLRKQKMARNVSAIARDAGVPRTTTAYILKKFQKWRLARTVGHKKRTYWRLHQ